MLEGGGGHGVRNGGFQKIGSRVNGSELRREAVILARRSIKGAQLVEGRKRATGEGTRDEGVDEGRPRK